MQFFFSTDTRLIITRGLFAGCGLLVLSCGPIAINSHFSYFATETRTIVVDGLRFWNGNVKKSSQALVKDMTRFLLGLTTSLDDVRSAASAREVPTYGGTGKKDSPCSFDFVNQEFGPMVMMEWMDDLHDHHDITIYWTAA